MPSLIIGLIVIFILNALIPPFFITYMFQTPKTGFYEKQGAYRVSIHQAFCNEARDRAVSYANCLFRPGTENSFPLVVDFLSKPL